MMTRTFGAPFGGHILAATLAISLSLGACNSTEERALALVSLSQCDQHQPTLKYLMLDAQWPAHEDGRKAYMAREVAETCSAGIKRLGKFYPDHPCIPYLESSSQMAEIAYGSYTGARPMTTADTGRSKLAQNLAVCLASNAAGVGQITGK